VSRRRQRARLSRVVAAAAASQGSCRGRRTAQGQCRVIGQLVAHWPVGVCVGWSPGSVHWYRRPGPARDLHPVSGGCCGRQGVQGWRRRWACLLSWVTWATPSVQWQPGCRDTPSVIRCPTDARLRGRQPSR
jgi:hypothetical protein